MPATARRLERWILASDHSGPIHFDVILVGATPNELLNCSDLSAAGVVFCGQAASTTATGMTSVESD